MYSTYLPGLLSIFMWSIKHSRIISPNPVGPPSLCLNCRRVPRRDHDGAAAAQDQLPPVADVPAVGAVRHRGVALPLPAARVHPGPDHHGHDHAPHARRHVWRGQVSGFGRDWCVVVRHWVDTDLSHPTDSLGLLWLNGLGS